MTTHRKTTRCLASLLVVLAVSTALQAQIDRATITGIVTDSSGAAVAGAKVTVTSTSTGVSVTVTTASDGSYDAPNLHIGTYSVEALASGFRKTVQSRVQLDVNQVARVDLKLMVGNVTEHVEVTEAPSLVESETSSLGTLETGSRIVDLPLNGRNFTQLAWLGPGTTPGASNQVGLNGSTDDNRPGISLSVNGLYGFDNNFLLDGVDNNGIGDGTIVVNPAPDAIAEFRIEENSMKAEFGRGGAAVNIALKSGTNQVHGGAYEFIRNQLFDARLYNFTSVPELKTPLHRNQFGFFLGGPLIKNRTFIFGDFQGLRQHVGLAGTLTVPTLKERTGDFSELGVNLYDPNTTTASGARALLNSANPSVIPAGRIDQVGQNIVNVFPQPNVPGQANGTLNNYYASTVAIAVGNQFDIRVDHKINEHNQMVGHSTFEDHPNVNPALMGSTAGGPPQPQGNIKTREQNHAVGYTRVFGTNLLNDLRFAFIRYAVTSATLNNGQNISQSLGIPNANRGTNVTSGLSFINFNGPYSFLGNSFYIPELVRDNTYQLADSVSWVKGKHTIKFGVDYRYYHRNFYQSQAPFGQFNFSGLFTQNLATGDGGNSIADTLLGLPNFREQDGLVGNNDPTHMWEMGEFFQDDFRVSKHLTLNLGLRYDTFSPVGGNKVGNFDLTKAIVVTNFGQGAVSNAGVGYDHKDFGPRAGFAWSPFNDSKTVLSGAFGVFYSPEGNQYNDLGENPPVLQFYQLGVAPNATPSPSLMIDAGFPAQLPSLDPLNPAGQVKTTGPVRQAPRVLEWNVTLQRELSANWVLHAAYVGTHATGIWNNEDSNLDQPLLPLDTNFSDPTGNMGRPYFSALPNLSVINPIDYPNFHITYNAFESKLEKRFSHGSTLLASYTWAHDIGTHQGSVTGSVGVQNAHNPDGDRGNVDPDFRHRFVASYTYQLPFGRGMQFGGGMNAWADAVVGGWQVAGITTIRSGEHFQAVLPGDDTNTQTSARPDLIHNPYDFSYRTDLQGSVFGCSNPGHQTRDCWFNQAAFAIPALAPGQTFSHVFGNAGNGVLSGPDQVNFDISLMKSFRITESHQIKFQADMFNAFNHPQFGLPANAVNPFNPATGTGGGTGAALISNTVGNQRLIQFALRYTF